MAVTVANTANTNSFLYWLTRTNELAFAMTTKCVTVNTAATTGNAIIDGYLISTGVVANTMSGGNSSTVTVLTFTSNVNIATGNTLSVGNSTINVAINSSSVVAPSMTIGGNLVANSTTLTFNGTSIIPAVLNVQTTAASAQIVDFFASASFRTAEYVVSIKDNNANAYQSSKLLVLQDTGDAHITEYGTIFSNTQLGVFTANANATHCRLVFTPTSTNTQIKGTRISIVV